MFLQCATSSNGANCDGDEWWVGTPDSGEDTLNVLCALVQIQTGVGTLDDT